MMNATKVKYQRKDFYMSTDPDTSSDVTVDADDLAAVKEAVTELADMVSQLVSDSDEGTGTEEPTLP